MTKTTTPHPHVNISSASQYGIAVVVACGLVSLHRWIAAFKTACV